MIQRMPATMKGVVLSISFTVVDLWLYKYSLKIFEKGTRRDDRKSPSGD